MDLTPAVPAPSDAPLKVAAILGSNREGRFGPVVARWFLARAAGHPDLDVELVELADAEPPARPRAPAAAPGRAAPPPPPSAGPG
ncbi:NADPH-dependent FMN reductase, partial [Streptomyces clavifer]|uniref:NADPH-dependent FMN reductase n=1 Tax=Streptomyces clavifer TaxID=68188 RepID=UPI0036476967